MYKVVVSGASGRMGREVLKAVYDDKDLQLVAAIDTRDIGQDVGAFIGKGDIGVKISDSLQSQIEEKKPDLMIDFTIAKSALANINTCLANKVRFVVGTTGIVEKDINNIEQICNEKKSGSIIAPNFTVGALLMMRFAVEAAKYFPDVEIIELHHDQKLDAPSGTAIKTAEMIMQHRKPMKQGNPDEYEKIAGSRGGEYPGGIRMHSVRLPGLFAHQEVLFGAAGQTLSIRHDSMTREAYMPGVLLAAKKIMEMDHFVYGLEKILF